MQSCLGLYVDKGLIKYAKVSKDKKMPKIEAYGVKFYDNLEETIEQIIKETYSTQIPISINLTDEQYKYSSLLNLLKPKDLEKAIETEFEYFCNTNSKNKNTIEYRRLISQNNTTEEDRDKLNIIYIYTNKTSVLEQIQLLDGYKVGMVAPVSVAISNLKGFTGAENYAIVNIEDETEITTMVKGKVYRVDKINKGMNTILKNINIKENSMSRAYEACKNTTVYTKAGQNLKIDGNEYLEEIILGLSDIIEEVKKTINKNGIEIDSIYLTGTGIVINNIDLFFQENFMDKKVEILIPYFIEKTNTKINIKDYTEVNSAIALGMQYLAPKGNEMNFSNRGNTTNIIKTLLSADVGKGTGKQILQALHIKESLKKELDGIEKGMLRLVSILLILIIFYIVILWYLTTNINTKIDEAETVIDDTNMKIAQVTSYKSLVDTRNSEYQSRIAEIDAKNNEITTSYSSKNAIPNLLNQMMYMIPKGVQLVSIENPTGKDIVIEAQAEKYDQLGYFKTALAENGLLYNVTTTKGENINGVISVTIKGELPY